MKKPLKCLIRTSIVFMSSILFIQNSSLISFGIGSTKEDWYEDVNYQLINAYNEEEFTIRETGKAPRINVEEVIKNIEMEERERAECLDTIKNTLNHEEELKATYRMIGVLAKKLLSDDYSCKTMVDTFGFEMSILDDLLSARNIR